MDFSKLAVWWETISTGELIWLAVGFTAQLMFSMRFIIQWIASERARKSIVPELFWYFSFFGGLMLLGYAIHRMDPVFILGQGTGLLIYSRNIYFIWAAKREAAGIDTGGTPIDVHAADPPTMPDADVGSRSNEPSGRRR